MSVSVLIGHLQARGRDKVILGIMMHHQGKRTGQQFRMPHVARLHLAEETTCDLQRVTFLEGYPGVLALQAVCQHLRGHQSEALQAAKVTAILS